jgi:transcriptional regulator with XRE-family HTH domain
MKNFGEIIKVKRKEKKLSLRDFASICGLSHTYIDCLEKGFDPRTGKPVSPTIDTLNKIANALDMSLVELLSLAGLIEECNNEENNQIKNKSRTNNHYNIIPPHLTPLLDAAKDLPPEKIEPLVSIAKHMGNEPSCKQVLKTQKELSFGTTKSSRESGDLWYIEEIKKGRPLNDAAFLCRLLKENIIKPTVYGHPLTQEQKLGLIRYIKSHRALLSDFKEDALALPKDYAAHDEGKESLDLEKEPELIALMKAADIINKMLHSYLEDEEKK